MTAEQEMMEMRVEIPNFLLENILIARENEVTVYRQGCLKTDLQVGVNTAY